MATQYTAPSILRTILRTLRNEETKARRLRTLLRSTVRESIYLSKYRLMNQMAIRSLVRKRSGFFSSTSLHRAREGGTGDDAVAALVGIWGLGGPSFLPSFLPSFWTGCAGLGEGGQGRGFGDGEAPFKGAPVPRTRSPGFGLRPFSMAMSRRPERLLAESFSLEQPIMQGGLPV